MMAVPTRRFALITGVVIACSSIFFGVHKTMQAQNTSSILTVVYPSPWVSLVPALQHTAVADSVLANQFEPLVDPGVNGVIEPLAAKSWKISADQKSFVFHIDQGRKFSNGVSLKPSHFKDAWENGLRLEPKSSNSSLRDVLYKMEGFEQFESTGTLAGIVADDRNGTLELRFRSPFRAALSYLSGRRFAVYLQEGSTYLGTGKYIIEEVDASNLKLRLNPHFHDQNGFPEIKVMQLSPAAATEAITTGKADVVTFAGRYGIPVECDKNGLSCFQGMETNHAVVYLNGLSHRFFSNPSYRLAAQSLILDAMKETDLGSLGDSDWLRFDRQVYLPLQPGRISEDEVDLLVNVGKSHIPAFVSATQRRPLLFVGSMAAGISKAVYTALKNAGVTFSPESGDVDRKRFFEMYYKTFEADIILGTPSVVGVDPDNLYHLLGSSGAITSPMIQREGINKLLENGRNITEYQDLAQYYSQVTRAVLTDVPFVHLGFTYDCAVYRNDVVKVREGIKNREEANIGVFEPR
jgi:ABC-type transport system substrate-binding protein